MNKVIITIISIFLLTGCINYKELEELSLISHIGIEKNNYNYILTLKEVTSQKEENNSKNKALYYKTTCKDLEKCFIKIKKKTTKTLYYPTVKTIIIGKENRQEILKSLFLLSNKNININLHSLIFLTGDSITKILKANNDHEYMNNLVKEKNNSFFLLKKEANKGKSLRIPTLQLKQKDIVLGKEIKERIETNE